MEQNLGKSLKEQNKYSVHTLAICLQLHKFLIPSFIFPTGALQQVRNIYVKVTDLFKSF